ncbi:C-terminal helicase domain-containing protein [Lederbergia ruris]|uniref:C-terminal helicase domain-containing protein n=1 Tax=Lederbergia ruris TaxID=217495 RepID=UPI001BB4388E
MYTIQQHLYGKTFEAIIGDVPNARRQEIIDEFTRAQPGSALISQITAGGVGLNIQAANIVILCEPQWKLSIEEQAISRAYRMGQSRNVIVYRLLTEESIDVTMLEVLGEKSNLFDLYARESNVASLALKSA